MIIEPLPDQVPFRVLVGGPVRKTPGLLRAHLASLRSQVLPPRVALTHVFVDDNTDPESSLVLREFLEQGDGWIIPAGDAATQDFSDQHTVTHQWTPSAMRRVGEHKNGLIQIAIRGGYDALWLLDSDLILHPRVLWSLIYSEQPIVCGVFWTRWQDVPGCPPLPQVWLRQPYQLDGRGMDTPEFLRRLQQKELMQVWGQGACTLYRREVLTKGLTFDVLPDLPTEGMWAGEDRHLCVRAERMHVPMYADAWPEIVHCYHPQEQATAESVTFEKDSDVAVGDWVSLHLEALEPVPQEDGGFFRVPKQHVRGRLGRLALCPDIEQHLLGMARGDTKIVPVEFPPWSESPLRGQRRLIEVTLVDHRRSA